MPSGDLDVYFRQHTNERLTKLEEKQDKILWAVVSAAVLVLIQVCLSAFGINTH